MRHVAGGRSGTASRLAKGFSLAAALLLVASAQGLADVRIVSSPGGEIESHLTFFAQVKKSGERVIIDGPCLSACTLVLSTVPRSRICMTSRAVLGFHAPFLVDGNGHTFRTRSTTQAMAASYPAPVRAWLRHKGGLTPQLKLLKGRELMALYPHC